MALLKTIRQPVLEQIKQQIEAKVPPAIKRDFLAVVVTGMRLIYDPKTNPIAVKYLDEALQKYEAPMAVAMAALHVVAVVARESKGKIRVDAAIYAAMVFMVYIWEFVQAKQRSEVTPQMVSASTRVLVPSVLRLFGITNEQLAKGIEAARQTGAAAPPSPQPGPPPVPQPAAQTGQPEA
jgi:hypothetical protein